MPTDDVMSDYASADEDYSSDAPVARPSMDRLVETAAKRGVTVSATRGLAATKRALPMATTRGLKASSTKRGDALAAAGLLPKRSDDVG